MDATHNGYRIESRSWARTDTGRFKLSVSILYYAGHSVTDYPFFLGEEFSTRDEAEQFGVRFAMDVIDGKVPNCSVN